ncbi:uncharacterized protein LOC143788135 [Ranitomeya variabilis]|uniref:uncharacterized protein LOC143788135 n=1 Tax=Ranitomeya variabilis TaxID=490064 RepID=UPI0040564D90
MGPRPSVLRLQDRVCLYSPISFLSVPSSQGKGLSVFPGHKVAMGRRGHHPGTSEREVPRFLFQSFHCTKEGRLSTSNIRPQASKQIRPRSSIPYGVPPLGNCLSGRGRVPCISRCSRRVPAHSHPTVSSALPPLRGPGAPFSVCRPTLRAGHRSSGVHQGHGSCRGHSPCSRHSGVALLGRHPHKRPLLSILLRGSGRHYKYLFASGLENQLQEIFPSPGSNHFLPGNDFRHLSRSGTPTSGKGIHSSERSPKTYPTSPSLPTFLHEGTRQDGGSDGGSALCCFSPPSPSTCPSNSMGQESRLARPPSPAPSPNQAVPQVVDQEVLPDSGEVFPSGALAGCHNGRQSLRLGCSVPTSLDSGSLVPAGIPAAHQHPRDSGNQTGSPPVSSVPFRPGGQSPVRQRHCGSLHQPPRRHSQQSGHGRGSAHSPLGRDQSLHTLSSLHPRRGKLGSGLSQSPQPRSRRVVSPSRNLSPDMLSMGDPGRGSNGISPQLPGSRLHGQVSRPLSLRSRRSRPLMAGFQTPIHLSPNSSSGEGNQEDQGRTDSSTSHRSGLAAQDMVRRDDTTGLRRTLEVTEPRRPPVSRAHLPPELRGPVFNGVAVESWVLRQKGLPQTVISTMLRARKPSSMRIYHRAWKVYFAWCRDRGRSPLQFSIPHILEFLQSGVDLGLALSSLKGQISALSVLFQRRIANRLQVRTFIQGVSHMVPPYKMPLEPWDLNLVLCALQEPPFEPLKEVSLLFLSWKIAFLVAVTSIRRVSELAALSCKPPFLVFHQDKVVLRTCPTFLPKVVSSFHLNEEIVLPSLCPAPSHRTERALHTLDLCDLDV